MSFGLNMFEDDLRNKLIMIHNKATEWKKHPFSNKSPNNENYLKIRFCREHSRGSRKNENQELHISKTD